MAADRLPTRTQFVLTSLIFVHIVICCVSLIRIADYKYPVAFDPTTFHVFFDTARMKFAILSVAALACAAPLFAYARFSFGYFVGFYLYSMILSYLWLNCFSNLAYDHWLAGLSAGASAIAFLLPALFISAPARQACVLSEAAFDRLLTGILLVGVVTIAIGSSFNFKLVGVEDIYDARDEIDSKSLNYLLGMTSGALLPFALAGFIARKAYWRAAAALLLLVCLYPVILTKVAFFTPLWLVYVLVLTRFLESRMVVVFSLLLPVATGLALIAAFGEKAALLFSIVNFRMIAVPAVALDVYNDFFSRHDLTVFCQVSFLKPLMHCPYDKQLSLVMEEAYKLGNFNASLFATEGIASVGTMFAPISAFACGLVVAIGNRFSAGLPAPFILVSGAVIPQVLLNVQLSTVLLTHGAGLLFMLWYVTPRSIFQQNDDLRPQVPAAVAA